MRKLLTTLIILFGGLAMSLPAHAGDGRKNKPAESCSDEGAFSSSFSFDEKTNKLTMSFEEEDLRKNEPAKVRFFKGRRFFRVNEAFEIPKELCEALGTPGPVLIKSGNYPLEYKDGTFTIVLCSGI